LLPLSRPVILVSQLSRLVDSRRSQLE
jgi:hypothetical protein